MVNSRKNLNTYFFILQPENDRSQMNSSAAVQQKKLIVIGGGAAGFFCAVNAAGIYPGLQVLLVEKSSKLLSKVKVSGAGAVM